jgi:holo-[acyl-carrier protein] synthase
MIAGIGIDLVSISRIKQKLKSDAFKAKVFAEQERKYCDASANSEQHYAVRFAAKEAFLKATGNGLHAGHDLNCIEVIHVAMGKPILILAGTFSDLMKKEGWSAIHLSLSHEGDVATAIVIIEK